MRSLWVVLIVITVLLAFSGGISAQTPSASPTTSIDTGFPAITSISLQVNPATSPMATPRPNSIYGDIQVTIQVSDFNLVDKVGQANIPGEGHIIYYFAHPPTFPLELAYSGPDTYSNGSTHTTFTWLNWNLTSYPYWVLAAQLVNNDDTPLNPPVYAEIITNLPVPGQTVNKPMITSMNLNTTAPSTPPASPNPNTTYMDAVINSQISGIELVPAGSQQQNAAGEGHYVYTQWVDPIAIPGYYASLDGNYTYSTNASPFTFLNVNPGYFSYSVQLVNNDDSAFEFPVYATIKTYLKPGTTASPSPTTGGTLTPSTKTPVQTLNPTSTPAATSAGVIDLIARNNTFETSSISVRAGSKVTIDFDNMDSGVQHNFSVYTDPTAATVIFRGPPITGIETTTYTFTAPDTPGTYFFRCDFHPNTMFGTVIVTP